MKVKHLFEDAPQAVKLNARGLTSLIDNPNVPHISDVTLDFNIRGNELTSLKGCPREVQGFFAAQNNNLVSLVGGPDRVTEDFVCSKNALTSLEGAPSFVGGDFMASGNQLTSLEGMKEVHGCIYVKNNNLTFKNVHKQIEVKPGASIYAEDNPTQYPLSFLLVENLASVSIDQAAIENIINKYLPNERGMAAVFECQEELIDAGFEEYSEL